MRTELAAPKSGQTVSFNMQSYQSLFVVSVFFSIAVLTLILTVRKDVATKLQVLLYAAPWLIVLTSCLAYSVLYAYTIDAFTRFSTQRDALLPGAGIAANIQLFMSYEQGMIALHYICVFVVRLERLWLIRRVGMVACRFGVALWWTTTAAIPLGAILVALSFYIDISCKNDGEGSASIFILGVNSGSVRSGKCGGSFKAYLVGGRSQHTHGIVARCSLHPPAPENREPAGTQV